ncbi:sugar kinase [Streptomyces sp. P38-E01]|uniref:Sugar kinase n=1 Tax=Streptomyces tardus TaxID=2780544 RepID=A0A949N7S0_9ACTN|nr:sugar kinase [Streptomyces tardus]MBU7600412.1 sugar kinase [Streptomyces tardus]
MNAAQPELVTIGEVMGLLGARGTGPLREGSTLRLGLAGAEATVAIGVTRLGHRAAWVGRVGADAVGTVLLDTLRGEGVDVSAARLDPDRPTGLMLRESRTADRVRISYYREGLAGSRLGPDDVDPRLVGGARVLHLTGITPALGASALEAVRLAARTARASGTLVSFDLNYRSLLWSQDRAAEVFTELLAETDVVFAGLEEAALVTPVPAPELPADAPELRTSGASGPERDGAGDEAACAARALRALGPAEAVVKLGPDGACVLSADGEHRQPALPVTSVDPVGAGDAFVAGYLSALLDGEDVPGRLRRGAVCGAFSVSSEGEWRGLPRHEELGLLGSGDISR